MFFRNIHKYPILLGSLLFENIQDLFCLIFGMLNDLIIHMIFILVQNSLLKLFQTNGFGSLLKKKTVGHIFNSRRLIKVTFKIMLMNLSHKVLIIKSIELHGTIGNHFH